MYSSYSLLNMIFCMYFLMPHRNTHTADPGYFLSHSWPLALSLPWPHDAHAYVCVHTSPVVLQLGRTARRSQELVP